MSYRPQFAYPPPPPGWKDEEFEYYFDVNNVPALAIIPSNLIPLPLQQDAEYFIRGIQVSGNTQNLVVRLWTPDGMQLSQTLIEVDRAYSGTLNGSAPVGRLPVPLEPEVPCPSGGTLFIDLALA